MWPLTRLTGVSPRSAHFPLQPRELRPGLLWLPHLSPPLPSLLASAPRPHPPPVPPPSPSPSLSRSLACALETCCKPTDKAEADRHIHKHRDVLEALSTNMGQILSWIRGPRDAPALRDVAVEEQVCWDVCVCLMCVCLCVGMCCKCPRVFCFAHVSQPVSWNGRALAMRLSLLLLLVWYVLCVKQRTYRGNSHKEENCLGFSPSATSLPPSLTLCAGMWDCRSVSTSSESEFVVHSSQILKPRLGRGLPWSLPAATGSLSA